MNFVFSGIIQFKKCNCEEGIVGNFKHIFIRRGSGFVDELGTGVDILGGKYLNLSGKNKSYFISRCFVE